MLRGTASVSYKQISDSCNIINRVAFFGASRFFSRAYMTNPGIASVKGIMTRLKAVCHTALLAQFWLKPRISSVLGSLTAIPVLISGYLINQLFAKPPAEHATVDTIPLRTKRRPPLAPLVIFLAAYLTAPPALQLAATAIR